MFKKEKCIILGGSGSGKDFLMRGLVNKGLKPGLKITTRPKRKKEIHGLTYNFMESSKFLEKLNSNEFLCHQTFEVTPEDRDPEIWYYGLTIEEFKNSQVFIMTPDEFSNIDPMTRINCFVVLLDIDRSIRENRLSKREDKNDSIKRRLDSDEKDFIGFGEYDLKITDPDFSVDDVYSLMY